jgi:hypothetical protein
MLSGGPGSGKVLLVVGVLTVLVIMANRNKTLAATGSVSAPAQAV